MVNYKVTSVKPTNTQLIKPNSTAKNKAGTTLKRGKKKFQGEDFSRELFLATR